MNRYHLFVRLPFAVCCLLLVVMGIFARRGWMDWRRMERHNQEIAARLEKSASEREDLAQLIRGLETSQLAQEQAVRQHLGYLRPDEIVIETP